MRPTDTRGLTPYQRAKLAYALEMLRSQGGLKGWTQKRIPETGTAHTVRLLKHVRGKLAQVYEVCRDEPSS